MTFTYHAYGLRITSDVPLPLPPGTGTPDLVLRRGPDREIPHERPPGERLAEVARPDHTIFYTLARGSSTVLRYPGLCDFTGDPKLERVTVHLHPGADEGLLPVLISGAVLAVHLMLHHALVLHASAVRTGGSAIAFVGSSGMGKSTLAAALCGLGCGLVSDDLLRVDDGMVHPGGTENRLRENARELATGETYETADGRLALRPRELVDAPLPLSACVVPRPSRDVTEVTLRRLGAAEALLRLSRYPRVLGWQDAASMAATFQGLGDLVERVPVFEATIPWGPPFDDGVLEGLLTALQPLDQRA
ncbi:MAG: hypothetical protein WBA97_04905 [Actinophytocola sp.]|uniref:hypothetical protein n=1 Tax=Actinophytocola sp. TaxID=1872138 RepID=UPI003C771748